jgi:hypothetical protein
MKTGPAARAGALGLAVVAAAVAVLCCSGPGILGSALVFLVGSWAGGVWLGGMAALAVAGILLLRRRRGGCRRGRTQGEDRVPRST